MQALFWYAAGVIGFGYLAVASLFDMLVNKHPPNMLPLAFAALAIGGVFGFRSHRRSMRASAARLQAAHQRARDLLAEMANGAMPVMTANKVIVRAGEQVHFAAPGELLKIQTTGYAAGTGGISVRVAKGVTVRSGAIRGGAIKELQAIAVGEFALLDKRLVFAGDMKSFEAPYAKLTHVEKVSDGVIVHVGETAHMIRLLVASYDVPVAHAVLDRMLAAV